tara:strand:- start:24018 stop:24866 length:849 start_codon:yes stop_codon:yes gene_type:complete
MDFKAGGVAVITGAGSGIGRALASACARQGMRLVLADVDAEALAETREMVSAPSQDILILPTDVSDKDQVQALADKSFGAFDRVDLLFNNAGVALGGPLWEMTAEDWAWLVGVNLMGVAHGISAFVPRMIAQKRAAHVVNTASAAGLVSPVGAGVYTATKHAVVALSECLFQDLIIRRYPIGVSVLCPSFVRTGISSSERTRPNRLKPETEKAPDVRLSAAIERSPTSADQVADWTLEAVNRGDFYILPHPEVLGGVSRRMRGIENRKAPAVTALDRRDKAD